MVTFARVDSNQRSDVNVWLLRMRLERNKEVDKHNALVAAMDRGWAERVRQQQQEMQR